VTWDGSKGGEFWKRIKEEKKMREFCFVCFRKE
jgi:hypothetical protein